VDSKTYAHTTAAEPVAPEPSAKVEEAPVVGDHGVLSLSGTAAPARTSRLSAKSSGILKRIYFREGGRVKTGQTLAELDATDIALRVESAQTAREQAEEAYQTAKKDFDRNGQLYQSGVLTAAVWEKVEAGLRMAELARKQADVGLRMAEQALADTRLRAPFGGVVTKLYSEEGQYITVMPPTMIVVLADTETLEVRVPVPERILAQVKAGLPVVVSFPSMGKERKSKVDRIADVIDPMTRSAEAIITIDNRDRSLPAGLYARVSFPTVRVSNDSDNEGSAAEQQPVAEAVPAPSAPTATTKTTAAGATQTP
jgi:RND family efflux transporter MFP subunit